MDRERYHHGNLKAALVAAGLEILETDGLGALSLRAIAARVGVSHAAPRNHFGSLRGLLTAIGAEGFRRHAAFMQEGLTCAENRESRLRAAMTGYVRFARTYPALFELMFSTQLCDRENPDFSEAGSASYAILAEISEGLDWPGAEGPHRQRRTEMMLWSVVHGYAQLVLAGQFGADDPDVDAVMPRFGYCSG